MNEMKVEPEIGSIPEIKATYFYIYSCMCSHEFKVKETTWIGSMSDSLRLAKGNVFMTLKEAWDVCDQLNARLKKICETIKGQRQKERIVEEAAQKKKEAAERKAEREKNVVKLDEKEKARRYEVNKQKREKKAKAEKKKVSPHPDIIL